MTAMQARPGIPAYSLISDAPVGMHQLHLRPSQVRRTNAGRVRSFTSSLQGAAATALRIDGALHEFTTITDVVEDVTDIILNVKEVVFKAHNPRV